MFGFPQRNNEPARLRQPSSIATALDIEVALIGACGHADTINEVPAQTPAHGMMSPEKAAEPYAAAEADIGETNRYPSPSYFGCQDWKASCFICRRCSPGLRQSWPKAADSQLP